jgi:hypothetical protein
LYTHDFVRSAVSSAYDFPTTLSSKLANSSSTRCFRR